MATGKLHERIGLIILGNSGVGKSFIANIFLGRDIFQQKVAATAVTTKTEFQEIIFEEVKYAVFNIPGLVEAGQAQIDTNKKEIDKAFEECPNAVIIYVFGNQNGIIRNEDIIAFNALNDAYSFESKSLVLVVNGLPSAGQRDPGYEGETIVLLRKLLDLEEWENICFLDIFSTEDGKAGEQKLRQELLSSILVSMPKVHVKQHDIRLQVEELSKLMKLCEELRKELYEERTQLKGAFRSAKERHEREMKKLQEKLEDLIRAEKKREKADAKQNQQERETADAKQNQQEREKADAGQRQQGREAAGVRYTQALKRGAATAAALATATVPLAAEFGPFAPLVVGVSTITGFAIGFYRKS